MQRKLFTLEKAPFLTIALFSMGLAFRYFEDFRKAIAKSPEHEHAFSLFIVFLLVGALSIGLYIGFLISERNISKNIERNKRSRT